MRYWIFAGFWSLLSLCIPCIGHEALVRADEQLNAVPRFALLIGVGKYPGLGESEQLDGSRNDVAAMRQLLMDRLKFTSADITTLVDEQATGEGIRSAFRALSESIAKLPEGAPPAQVLIHFSGHGSQVPDQPSGPQHDEEDGLDETWVPYDATKQGGAQDILDDEIGELVDRICQKGKAQVFITADCCHSGTGARGATKFRQLPREVTPTKSDEPINQTVLPDGIVFLSACRDCEVEPEFRDGDKTYGLLTRFLVGTLSEQRNLSNLSYDLLQKAIVANYRRDSRVTEIRVPQLEGSDAALKRTFLAAGNDVDLPPFFEVKATASPDQVLLLAGSFHHVTVGSLFQLYERPEELADASAALAWLRISRVDGTTSKAQVIRWGDQDQSKPVAFKLNAKFKQGIAVLRRAEPEPGSLRLKVVWATGQDTDSDPLAPGDSTLPKAMGNALKATAKPGETPWLNWVTDADQPCDLVLRMEGNYGALFPATGFADAADVTGNKHSDVPKSLRGGWGPIDLRTGKDDSKPPQGLDDYLRRITRSRNIMNLAQSGAIRGTSPYQVKLELLDVDYDTEKKKIRSTKPWEPDKKRVLSMRDGQEYAARVTNEQKDGKPIYVTVLEISPSHGIEVVLPYRERFVKLEPGTSTTSNRFRCAAPHGQYQFLLLVTREESNFSFVKQPDLPKTSDRTSSGAAGSLADQLAEFAYFQPPTQRGAPRLSDTTWHAEVLTWRTAR